MPSSEGSLLPACAQPKPPHARCALRKPLWVAASADTVSEQQAPGWKESPYRSAPLGPPQPSSDGLHAESPWQTGRQPLL